MFYWKIYHMWNSQKLHPGPEWFIFHHLTREFIVEVISVISLYYFIGLFVYLIKRTCGKNNILWKSAASKIFFCHSKIKFISSRHCVISSIYLHATCHCTWIIKEIFFHTFLYYNWTSKKWLSSGYSEVTWQFSIRFFETAHLLLPYNPTFFYQRERLLLNLD